MAAKSDYLEKKILDYVLTDTADWAPTSVHLSLHTADPTDAGTGAEVSGNGYGRQAITFNAAHATNGSTTNSSSETFTASGGSFGTVTHFGIFDASSGGNLLYHGALTASKTIADGDSITFAADSITITEA